jgi:hypothetical protein
MQAMEQLSLDLTTPEQKTPGDVKSPIQVYKETWKEVDYFGYDIHVPTWAKYMATDADGAVFAYEAPPTAYEGKWSHLACYKVQLVEEFATLESIGQEWNKSLMEIV